MGSRLSALAVSSIRFRFFGFWPLMRRRHAATDDWRSGIEPNDADSSASISGLRTKVQYAHAASGSFVSREMARRLTPPRAGAPAGPAGVGATSQSKDRGRHHEAALIQ